MVSRFSILNLSVKNRRKPRFLLILEMSLGKLRIPPSARASPTKVARLSYDSPALSSFSSPLSPHTRRTVPNMHAFGKQLRKLPGVERVSPVNKVFYNVVL